MALCENGVANLVVDDLLNANRIFHCYAQKQFSELLMKAASDYGALTASVSDFQWSQNFREPPSVWGVY